MSFPESLTPLAKITAQWLDFTGEALPGECIKLVPTARLVYDSDSDYAFVNTPIYLEPSSPLGKAEVEVIPTNDPNVTPSGWAYRVIFPRSWGVAAKNIFAPAGTTIDLFTAPDVVPTTPVMSQYVRTVEGIEPDVNGNVDLPGSGGGGVTDHGALTGLADDDHPQYLNNARGDARYDVLDAALTAITSHVGAANPHGQYLRETDADALYSPLGHEHPQSDVTGLVAVLASLARKPIVRQEYITDASGATLPDTASTWQPVAGFELSIPASVGDYVDVSVRGLRTGSSTAFLDVAIIVDSTLERFLATGNGTPASEGDPGWYGTEGFTTAEGPRGFVVTADDLDDGSVRLVVATKAQGSGTLYANTVYPFYWRAVNHGPVD